MEMKWMDCALCVWDMRNSYRTLVNDEECILEVVLLYESKKIKILYL
jgi:hypothetical protein